MFAPRLALLLSGLVSFVALGASMSITGAALPVYERLFGIDTATSGLLVSTLWVSCLLGVVTMYFRAESVTPRLSLGGIVLGSVILAVAPTWGLTLVGAVVFGYGYGLVAAVYNPRILVAWGESGPSKVSMLNAVFSAGAILAPWVFGLIGSDQRPVFWAMAVIGAVAWGLAGGTEATGQVRRAEAGGFQLRWPVLGFAILGIGTEASLAGLGPSALIRTGLSEDKAASLLALFFIAALVARVGLVLFSHRLPDFGIYLGGAAWALICALGAATVSAPFFFPLMGVSAGMFFQGTFVTGTRQMGDDPRVSPILMGVGLVGATIAPIFYAQLMELLGNHGFFWLVAGVMGVATLGAVVMWRPMMAQRA